MPIANNTILQSLYQIVRNRHISINNIWPLLSTYLNWLLITVQLNQWTVWRQMSPKINNVIQLQIIKHCCLLLYVDFLSKTRNIIRLLTQITTASSLQFSGHIVNTYGQYPIIAHLPRPSKAPFTPTGDIWRCTGAVFTTANSPKIASASPEHRQMIWLTTYWRPFDAPVATHKHACDDVLTTLSRPLTTSWRCTDDHWHLTGELVKTYWQHCDV